MKDIVCVVREYTKQDGTQGAEFVKVGAMGVSQNGKEFVILEPHVNLAGLPRGEKGGVMCSVIDRQNQQNNNQGQQQPQYNQQQGGQPQYNQGQPNQNQNYNQNGY